MEAIACSQEKVNLYFVRPVEGASSACLLAAYQACESFQSRWMSADECLELRPSKQDVFICDPFEGKAFYFLTSGLKCLVVGPRCVLSCLHRLEPIPQLPSPIHSMAMHGLVITTTGFHLEQRNKIKQQVEYMAGIYSANFHMGITHLVAKEVGSNKYQVAVKQEVPVMMGEWISAVWETVSHDVIQHISATDDVFLRHSCPVFHGLEICISQLDQPTKMLLKGVIEENGGSYFPMLIMDKTSVLIVPTADGDKYRHACQWRIKALTPDWIYDSVQRGHALPTEPYEVRRQRLNTPTPAAVAAATVISTVTTNTTTPGDETLGLDMPQGGSSKVIEDGAVGVMEGTEVTETLMTEIRNHSHREALTGVRMVENMGVTEVQAAGLFLDGCKIYLSGWSGTMLEKVRRVLNLGGATRFNTLSHALTHVLIGKLVDEDMAIIKTWSSKPHLVYATWVTESIRLRRPADETPFLHPLEEKKEEEEEISNTKHKQLTNSQKIYRKNSTVNNTELLSEEDEVLKQYLRPKQFSTTKDLGAAADQKESYTQPGSAMFSRLSQKNVELHNTHPHNTYPSQTKTYVDDHHMKVDYSLKTLGTETPSRVFHKTTMKRYNRNPTIPPEGKDGTIVTSTITGPSATEGKLQETHNNAKEIGMGTNTNGPLQGVVVCGCTKLFNQFREISKVVKELGGEFYHNYDINVTHFLYCGKTNDLNKEFRRARQDGKFIVAPDWLWTCQEKRLRVEESLFPHTLKPNMSITLTSSMEFPANVNRGKRKYVGNKGEERSSEQDTSMDSNEEEDQKSVTQEKEKLSKQLKEIGDLAQMSRVRSEAKRRRGKPKEWNRTSTARHVDMETQPISGEEQESQNTAITWEDPVERAARLHLQNQLAGDRENQLAKGTHNQIADNEEVPVEEKDDQNETHEENEEHQQQQDLTRKTRQNKTKQESTTYTKKSNHKLEDERQKQHLTSTMQSSKSTTNPCQAVFVLVGMSEERRQRYSRLVGELGATTTTVATFDPATTHLLSEVLNRSERTLAAIAAGKWVLHLSYLEDSHNMGYLLQEDTYAWGNPSAYHLPELPPDSTCSQLAKAAWRWRMARTRSENEGEGCVSWQPFEHMVALILSSKDREEVFARMIKAGGGKISRAKPPYHDLRGVTHLFLEIERLEDHISLEPFVFAGVPCLSPVYINNLLITYPPLTEELYYVSQYRKLKITLRSHQESGQHEENEEGVKDATV